MDPMIFVSIGIGVFLVVAILVMWARFYRKVDQGQALIVNKMRDEPDVYFTGSVVLPIVHRAEVMDISLKTITLERRGKDGLICQDNIRADIKVSFYVRVNKTRDAVLQVAQTIGVRRASDRETLEDLFLARFSEALKTVGKRLEFEALYEKRNEFKDQIIEIIGDLNGYVLQDAAIDYLEQTMLDNLDPNNILDAQGIRKITELTAAQNIRTNEFRQAERKAITRENVLAEEAILALQRQEADARAKQTREIATVIAREEAETATVQADEGKRAHLAQIKADEEVSISIANKDRQVEVAVKNKERIVGIEEERVQKDRELEAISREREVELQRISKEKELEQQRKEIAEVIRGRVAVDRDVATEEERILDVRSEAAANRDKLVKIIGAEAGAQEALVKTIKAAEAQEEVAKFAARERILLADADLAAAERTASAKIRAAEGIKAEEAASGLARVLVKEADAIATEKLGLAEAKVALERMKADAEGEEKKGLARVKVLEAEAGAIEKKGSAEAEVTFKRMDAEARGTELAGLAKAKSDREQMIALADGEKSKGLADVAVKEADAVAIQKRGEAEASAIELKLGAEAKGLEEKAKAMKALDGIGREHEEFRLRLDQQKEIELATIGIQEKIARAHSEVMKEAFGSANIQIVGGDGAFFDRFVKAVTMGRSIDGVVDNSNTVKALAGDYLSGKSSLSADLKEVLSRPALNAEALQQLSVAAVLTKLAGQSDPTAKRKIEKIIEQLKTLGLDETNVE